jgi:hypothetical protein
MALSHSGKQWLKIEHSLLYQPQTINGQSGPKEREECSQLEAPANCPMF